MINSPEKFKNYIKTENLFFYIAVFLVLYAMALVYNTIDMDYWARLLQGEAFWELSHILKHDPFSYTATHIWIDHEWGASVVFAFVQNIFGFKGILFFRSLIVFLIFFFIFQTIKINMASLQDKKDEKLINSNNLFNILFFLMNCFALPTLVQSGLRCHFFTFLFFSVYLYILELVRNGSNKKILFILPIIMLFWANIHGGCVSGLGLLFLYSLGEYFNHNKTQSKNYLIILIFSVAVLFINPYGVDYVKFIMMAATMERPFVTEWISPFAHSDITFLLWFKIIYILNIIIIIFSLKKDKLDYTKYILLAVCAYLSFKYIKNTPFFIIVSMIFLYNNYFCLCKKFRLLSLLQNFSYKIIYAVIIIVCLFIIMKYPMKPIVSQQPYKSAEFLKINKMQGNILSPFDMGSYLAYKLFPQNLIYMDGRYEEVYYNETKACLDNFYNVQGEWDKVLKLDIMPDYIIIPQDALVNDYMKENKLYSLIYNDGENNLYVKEDIKRVRYKLPANDLNYYSKTAFDKLFYYKNKKTNNFVVK